MATYENKHIEIQKEEEKAKKKKLKNQALKEKKRLKHQWLFKQVDPYRKSEIAAFLNHVMKAHISQKKIQAKGQDEEEKFDLKESEPFFSEKMVSAKMRFKGHAPTYIDTDFTITEVVELLVEQFIKKEVCVTTFR